MQNKGSGVWNKGCQNVWEKCVRMCGLREAKYMDKCSGMSGMSASKMFKIRVEECVECGYWDTDTWNKKSGMCGINSSGIIFGIREEEYMG